MQKYYSRPISSISTLLLCLLLVLLSACGSPASPQSNAKQNNGTPAVSQTATVQPTATSQPVQQTDTSCPAADTARAAVMPLLALGTHPAVVYTWNQFDNSGDIAATLRRYDTTNGSKFDIAVLPHVRILNAQVSADGQWVLFVTNSSDHAALQLVRIDGKYLQTLYCYKYRVIDVVKWSPDQKTVALEENSSSLKDHPILTLNLTNGTLQTIVNDFLTLETWVDNSHFIVASTLVSSSVPGSSASPDDPLILYLADATKHDVQKQDLSVIWKGQSNCYTVIPASNPNVLYLSQCALIQHLTGVRQPSQIISIPMSGALPVGWPQKIMIKETNDIIQMSFINQQSLLYATMGDAGNNGLWRVSTDGNQNVTHLLVANDDPAFLNRYSRYTWSNVSRDGAMYVVRIAGSLQVGPISGGTAKAFAQADNNFDDTLQMAGWTTI